MIYENLRLFTSYYKVNKVKGKQLLYPCTKSSTLLFICFILQGIISPLHGQDVRIDKDSFRLVALNLSRFAWQRVPDKLYYTRQSKRNSKPSASNTGMAHFSDTSCRSLYMLSINIEFFSLI